MIKKNSNLGITRRQIRLLVWPLIIFLLVTVGIPLIFFFYWFDAAKVKQIVSNQFNNQNYSVVINGSVEPRTWHGLSIFISDLTVEDKQQHKVLHINTANGQLSWLDLIVGKYKIKRIALNGLTFYQNNANRVNYASLLNYNNIAKSEFNNLTYLSISNLNLIESTDKYVIRDASLYISEMASSPLIKLNFQLAKYHAKINFQGQVSQIENNKILLDNLSTIITSPQMNIELQSSASYAYQSQELWLEDTRGVIKSKNYTGSINIDTALLSGYGLTIDSLLFNLNNSQGKYNQTYNVGVRKMATTNFVTYSAEKIISKYVAANANSKLNLNIEVNDASIDKNFNLANQGCKLNFKYGLPDASTSGISGNLKGECNYFESNSLAKLDLTGQIDGAPAKISLDYLNSESKPFLRLTGALTSLDLSKLSPKEDAKLFPLYNNERKLPLAWINWFEMDAHLTLNELNLGHIILTNVDTALEVKGNQLRASPLQAEAYDGTLNSTFIVKNLGESYDMAIKSEISGINLKKVFSSLFNVNAIEGRANLSVNTAVKNIVTFRDFHQKFNGGVSLTVSNGGFSGVDFSVFLSPENLAAFQNRNVIMTNFTSLKANFDFINGISEHSNLAFSSPTIMASGDGLIDFATNKIDYKLKVSSILPKNVQNIKSVSIPVGINGDLFSPKFYIQNMTLTAESEKSGRSHKLHKHK